MLLLLPLRADYYRLVAADYFSLMPPALRFRFLYADDVRRH